MFKQIVVLVLVAILHFPVGSPGVTEHDPESGSVEVVAGPVCSGSVDVDYEPFH